MARKRRKHRKSRFFSFKRPRRLSKRLAAMARLLGIKVKTLRARIAHARRRH